MLDALFGPKSCKKCGKPVSFGAKRCADINCGTWRGASVDRLLVLAAGIAVFWGVILLIQKAK